MTTVSVIVPLYNQGHFLPDTIDSILLQTYRDFEVIIVNDASTDDSLKVAKKYASDRIKIVSNPINRGLPATRNVGLIHATGRFILPLDSDDQIDPTYLEKAVAKISSRDNIAVVSTWMHMYPDEACKHDSHTFQLVGQPGSSYPIFPPTRQQILTGNSLAVCSLIRKEALVSVGNYPEEFTRGSEDWCLWAAIVCSGKWAVEVIPEYLFRYRVHDKSMCRSATMAPFLETQARIRAKFNWQESQPVVEIRPANAVVPVPKVKVVSRIFTKQERYKLIEQSKKARQ